MDIRRGDGWPRQVGGALLAFGLGLGVLAAGLDLFYGLPGTRNARLGLGFAALLLVLMGFLLLAWRRVTTLDRRERTLQRWWGLALGSRVLPINGLDRQKLEGYDRLVIVATCPEEHYKRPRNQYQLQLERSADGAFGRLRLDDELVSQGAARELGTRVAEFLGVELELREGATPHSPKIATISSSLSPKK